MVGVTNEGWHRTADGVKLFKKSWRPINPASASIVFLHGFSDHCVRFTDLFQNLVASGIEVHAFDQRGWGRSVTQISERGMTGPTSQVLKDITGFLESLLSSPIPLFVMGHSMGGQEIVSRLDPKYMCRDETTRSLWSADELCYDTGTLEGIVGMLDRAKELQAGLPEIRDWEGLSIASFHGTGDVVCECKDTEKYLEDLPVKDKKLFVYQGVYHCIHLEPEEDKRRFTEDAATWILGRS
ncbi:Alpha/Beta hydrolase protein [Nemania sp. NC0429]|nr:Alpha/Beta hydrolase protein [Nemania sp. NC0429]